MARNIQFKRGTKAKNDTFIGPDGSISIDKESKTLRVHNGATAGGAFTILDADAIGSYGKYAKLITDWNDANENGVFMGDKTCANAPESGFWSMGHVENHGGAGYCTQFVHCFADDFPTNTRTYRREQNNGTFGAWYRLRLSEEEQKAIFMPLTGGVVETKTIGDNSQYIANTKYVSDYIGSWLVISPPAAGGDLVVSLTMAAASALSISGYTSNDVNLIFDDSIPSNINYRPRIIFNNTSKNLVVKNLTGPTVTIAKNARVTVYSNGSGFFRTEEDNELIYGNQLSGYVVTGNLEFSGTGIGKQSVRQWVSATSDAGYKTISLPVSCIPHSITGVTTDPENATAYSLKITYKKDGSLQSSFRAAVVNSSNAYVSGIRFNISVEGSM